MNHHSNAYHWLTHGDKRQDALIKLTQPMTANQLSKRMSLTADSCSRILSQLVKYDFVLCLNPHARRSRLYYLTSLGEQCQDKLCDERGVPRVLRFPDWVLYGQICFSHRSTVIRTLTEPMQPSKVKKIARLHNPKLRMSANNVRDVMKFLVDNGLAVPIRVKKLFHLRYELTDIGKIFQHLLRRSGASA